MTIKPSDILLDDGVAEVTGGGMAVSLGPAVGGLNVERVVNTLEPAADGRTSRRVGQHVQAVGRNRICGETGHLIDTEGVLLGRSRHRPLRHDRR